MEDFAGIDLSSESFAALAALCKQDKSFPQELASWQAMVRKADAESEARGKPVSVVGIDIARFKNWCDAFAVPLCLDAFRAYCIIHKVPKGTQHYGQTSLDTDIGPFN